MLGKWSKLSGIFLLSVSLLMYEVGLTRLFSAIFVYHYAFLVISFAILGLGVGGFILHLTRKKEGLWAVSLQRLYGLVYLLTLAVIYFLPFLQSPLIYVMIGTIPFVIGGYLLAYYFKEKDSLISQLYFADLLGSTVGVLLILLIFQKLGTFQGLIFISATAFFSTIFLEKRGFFRITSGLMGAVILSLILLPGVQEWGNDAFRAFYTSPFMGKTGAESAEYTYWDGFSRTDVFAEDKFKSVVLLDGSAASVMYKFDGDLEKVEFLKNRISHLPLTFNNPEKVLLIGPGGGEDILQALLAGVKDITAVEINAGSVKAVEEMAAFSGNPYKYPGVKTYIKDARNFVEENEELYDQIYLALVMTNLSDNGGRVLAENYIYTEEAIRAYLQDLTDNGMITFLMHDERDLIRLVTTLVNMLIKDGVPKSDIVKRIAIFLDPNQHHVGMYPVIVFKKTPFTKSEAAAAHEKIVKPGYQFFTMPYYHENNPLGDISTGSITYREFQNQFTTNMDPVTDDKPFIYNYSKTVPSYLRLILIFLPLVLILGYFYGQRQFRKVQQYSGKMLYFIILGVGFMFLEIFLIQRFAVYLGYPVLTFVAVLSTLLFSSGFGSYFSTQIRQKINPLLFVGIYGVILSVLLGYLVKETITFALPVKLAIIFCSTAPLGFFMGMAFPLGINHLKSSGEEGLVPLVWALNGVASVLGSVLSMVIALQGGFRFVAFVGAGLYLVSYFIYQRYFTPEFRKKG